MHIVVEREFHGSKLRIETGKVAKQAAGAAVVTYGDTVLLVTACLGVEKPGDFVPLTVDYVEKTYAAGKIPGGYFKREGKLSEQETLVSRLIDRPCRPLFPEGFNKEVQVIVTVMSADQDHTPDVLAMCGASAALMVSEIPFEGPISGVRVGRVGGKLIINPNKDARERSDLNFVVAGSKDAIVMVEGGAAQASEKEVVDAIFFAHEQLQIINEMQLELVKACGKKKIEFAKKDVDEKFITEVQSFIDAKLKKAMCVPAKEERRVALSAVKDEMKAKFIKADDVKAADKAALCSKAFEDHHYTSMRSMILDKKVRIDGRDLTTVRPITIETSILPRVHGSSLFTRGETQAIVTATLGTADEAQRFDNIMGDESKRFMLHYNFPPFSVGECKGLRGTGRREVGHGALAERAVKAILPTQAEFPYVIRIVSEITESNGSSSMASVCGASLSLMDAGVPIKAPVAGVAMGLISEGSKYSILTDILGDEDHLGDMDFKVCGTEKGITALQMDIKIKGLRREIVVEAMDQAREGRLHVLKNMNAAISTHREEMSLFAPRVTTLKISQEKIRDIIGPQGKTIRSITESFGVKIEVKDDGTVSIFSTDPEKTKEVLKVVKALTEEAEVGKIYTGIVKKITDFGAFVEIMPGTSGLLHISQLSDRRVEHVTDIVKEGDQVPVKVLEVDRMGKIRLSRKEALEELGLPL
ncbi:MAG: polyribonucleotide nucleotidyltransferase [bacterium]|nr:polyribonucleotide nucleotidyltransferase [bacterium]